LYAPENFVFLKETEATKNLKKIIAEVKSILKMDKIKKYLDKNFEIKNQLPGRPSSYPEQSMIALLLIMVFKNLHSFRQYFEYLKQNPSILSCFGLKKIPCRHTLVRRMKQLRPTIEKLIELMGQKFIEEGICDPKDVAVDCKAFHGLKFDGDCTWFHTSKGLVRGYGLTVVCTSTKEVLPLFAKAHTSKKSTVKIFENAIYKLPEQTKFVLADSEYENLNIIQKVEQRDEQGFLSRRAVIAPRDVERMKHLVRIRNYKYFKSSRGQKKFSRRLPSIEGFFANLCKTFRVKTVSLKGKNLVFPFLLFWVFAYQVLFLMNKEQSSKPSYSLKHLFSGI
jgi:hypothetical protein